MTQGTQTKICLTSVGRPNYVFYNEAPIDGNGAEERGFGFKSKSHGGDFGMGREAPLKADKPDTRMSVLEAAKKVLRQYGYSKLSTRDVAAAAGVPLSQIHYHFGSKQGMVLALFEYLNSQLLDRQAALFDDATLKLSEQWDRACDYLDDDIASGYVRVLQELIAASWADAPVAKVIRAGHHGMARSHHGSCAAGRT